MRRSADVVKEYNELAIAMPAGAWSKRFANSRMEDAPGSGRIRMEFRVWIASEKTWVPDHKYMTTTEACNEIERLKSRESRYKAKHKKRKKR